MPSIALRSALPVALFLLSGCTLPGGTYVGGSTLPLHALAITSADPVTGVVTSKVELTWPASFNAKTYQVIRTFNGQSSNVATLSTPGYTDPSTGPTQQFSYQIQALSGEGKELITSAPVPVTVLQQTVAKPTGLTPADKSSVAIGANPTFSWQPVTGANWYYINVVNINSSTSVWSALTASTSIPFGASSPLNFSNFTDFPTASTSSIQPGLVYRWTVQALRGDKATPDTATAVDVNSSAPQTFSQGN
jgi:hypothetical protein